MKTSVVLMMALFVTVSGHCQIFNPVLNDAFVVPRGGLQVTAGYSAPSFKDKFRYILGRPGWIKDNDATVPK